MLVIARSYPSDPNASRIRYEWRALWIWFALRELSHASFGYWDCLLPEGVQPLDDAGELMGLDREGTVGSFGKWAA